MKVCLLNDSFPPVIDGVVNVMLNYARYLPEYHRCDVMVGTPEYPGAQYEKYPYPVVPYPSLDTAALSGGYRAGIPFAPEALERLAGFHPDIIHTHSPASALLVGRMLREKTEAPLVYTYHTKYDIDIRRVIKIPAIADEGIRVMIDNISAADEIWTVSGGAGENLRELGFQGTYTVMNNGVDFAKGKVSGELIRRATDGYDLPEVVPLFLYVGRLITYKGLPMILDALKMIRNRGMDFRMVFIGTGPDEKLLKDRVSELGLGDRCFFTGPIRDRDILRAWDSRADLFLFPSTFDTNGLVVREAAACGLASVLIRGSCAAEGITDGRNGFLIEENAESLAAKLEETGSNFPLLHEAGMHAMDEIYLSWQDAIRIAYQRYERLLELKNSGKLPAKKKEPADLIIGLTVKQMAENEKFRRFRSEILDDFRETAVGMMENIQEDSEEWTRLRSEVRTDLKDRMEEYRKQASSLYQK